MMVIIPEGVGIIHGDDMFTVDGASVFLTSAKCLDCRCEQTLFNAPGEALALTDAARLFLSSEKENRALQAPGFDEHLQAALNCYSFAIKVHSKSWFLITFLVHEATALEISVKGKFCSIYVPQVISVGYINRLRGGRIDYKVHCLYCFHISIETER